MIEVEGGGNSRYTSTYILSHPEYDNVWGADSGDTDIMFDWMICHLKTLVTGIQLTHAHFNHIYGMNAILSRNTECAVYVANEYGKKALYNPKTNGSKYTEEGSVEIVNGAKIECNNETIQL